MMDATIAELKNNLHKLVVETEDQSVLQYVETIFKSMIVEKSDWWDELSADDKASINRGVEQLNDGVAHRHEDVMKKVNHLLASRG